MLSLLKKHLSQARMPDGKTDKEEALILEMKISIQKLRNGQFHTAMVEALVLVKLIMSKIQFLNDPVRKEIKTLAVKVDNVQNNHMNYREKTQSHMNNLILRNTTNQHV